MAEVLIRLTTEFVNVDERISSCPECKLHNICGIPIGVIDNLSNDMSSLAYHSDEYWTAYVSSCDFFDAGKSQ